ncbi:MAG TPA: carboxylesterase family protein [Steroidobacteraceae bacterium]|jgi:para-nitrobenzyl esterase|nr:carboxylesterase family protein [Steroidobacteraceae bacterium]
MHPGLKWLLASLLVAPAFALAQAAPAAAGVTVKTPAGFLRGAEQDGMRRFLGVPYAQAPLGELRWRAPQPLPAGSGTRDALQFGPECMQGQRAQAPVAMSEDCLYLNLWVASKRASRHLPVLVWVHGGAFKVGSAGQPVYDGASLARRGLVVVTLNYRLGKFGFLAHPALTRENPDGPLGNYGLMDVIAALKWVQANIKSFGGDPRKVTLAGQSAGGAAVYELMTSPLAAHLYSRAIIESGVFSTPLTPFASAEQAGAAAARTWDANATDAAALRKLSAAQIQGEGAPLAGDFGPMIDGKLLPQDIAAAFDQGQIAPVPLLIGSNSYEAGFFGDVGKGLAQRLGTEWRRVTAVYDGYGSNKTELIEKELITDTMITAPTRTAARAAAAHGSPTFLYYYSYVRPAQRDQVPGASHMDEVYALFGHMNLMPGGAAESPDALPVVGAMQERWARFVTSGNPASKSEPWPALDLEYQQLLEFSDTGEFVRTDFASQRLDLAAAMPRLTPAR